MGVERQASLPPAARDGSRTPLLVRAPLALTAKQPLGFLLLPASIQFDLTDCSLSKRPTTHSVRHCCDGGDWRQRRRRHSARRPCCSPALCYIACFAMLNGNSGTQLRPHAGAESGSGAALQALRASEEQPCKHCGERRQRTRPLAADAAFRASEPLPLQQQLVRAGWRRWNRSRLLPLAAHVGQSCSRLLPLAAHVGQSCSRLPPLAAGSGRLLLLLAGGSLFTTAACPSSPPHAATRTPVAMAPFSRGLAPAGSIACGLWPEHPGWASPQVASKASCLRVRRWGRRTGEGMGAWVLGGGGWWVVVVGWGWGWGWGGGGGGGAGTWAWACAAPRE